MNEFIQLHQGSLSVTNYIKKFDELSQFAPYMVSTDELKVERFLEGLRPKLNRNVRMAGTREVSFAVIVDRALIVDQAELKIVKAGEA